MRYSGIIQPPGGEWGYILPGGEWRFTLSDSDFDSEQIISTTHYDLQNTSGVLTLMKKLCLKHLEGQPGNQTWPPV